jgi:regulator of protease activity HflC (stomatin/prohibitin superfamily)
MSLIYIVPQSHCVVLERFGKFTRIQQAGLRFRIPILESIRSVGTTWGDTANKRGFLIELTEQQTDTPPRECHTKDNVPVTANASVYWRITDPRKALYEVDILPSSISDIALNALRSNIGEIELDNVLSERAQLNERISSQLSETAKKWGVIFTRVEIQELSTDESVSKAMLQQMDAERRRRAVVADAEGRARAEVMVAEAEKTAAILRAEGRAKALELLSKAERVYLDTLGSDAAPQLLLAQKYIDGFEVISKKAGDKVFIPNSFHGLFSFPIEDKNSLSETTVQT